MTNRGKKGHAKKVATQKATNHPWRKPFYFTIKDTNYKPSIEKPVV